MEFIAALIMLALVIGAFVFIINGNGTGRTISEADLEDIVAIEKRKKRQRLIEAAARTKR